MNMQEVIQAQIIEAQVWIRDCSWLDQAEDLGNRSEIMYQIVGCVIAKRNAPARSKWVLYLSASPLEDLTDEEVRRGIDSPRERLRQRHYDGGWTQFLANCQFNKLTSDI